MINVRLELQDLSIPITKDVPVSITYVLADVREPDKRSASFSKTISIPESSVINKFFENIFEINIKTQVFNKNKKTPVKYYVGNLVNFKGDLQLTKIVIDKTGAKTYECNIKGEGGSLFLDIGDKLITGNPDPADNLDFSAYDHNYTRANQIALRSNWGTGLGVLYPFIDKGSNGGSDLVYSVEDFIPCFSKYEYVKKIIEKAGYTYTSSILESTEFKKQITYPNLQSVSLSPSQLSNRQFYVGLTSDVVITGAITFINNTRETSPFFDVGNQVSGIVATINDSGQYNTAASHKVRVAISHTDPTVTYAVPFATAQIASNIWRSTNGGGSFQNIANQTTNFGNFIFNNRWAIGNNDIVNQCATGDLYLNSGDQLKHEIRYNSLSWKYYNASNVEVTTGTGTVVVSLRSGSAGTSFYTLATAKVVTAGNLMNVNNALPVNIKQKDYLKSIIQAFNLNIEPDKENPKHLVIESYDDFYSGDIIDWMDPVNKVDLDKEQTVNPNILEAKRYIFTYKDDGDFYNKKYKDAWGETFGCETITIENDFQKADKKNELIFSATPNVANLDLGIAMPKIYAKEGITIKPFTPNIRWLFCGGVKQSAMPYTYKETGQPDLITTDYLYAGHTDDPFNPTIDLNFGFPKEVYYNFIGSYFTNNNLYNRFQKNALVNITDRDSKFCTKYIWVSASDINQFSFRNRYYIDFAYYIVNKIEDYDPTEEKSVKFELIKLIRTETFSPSSFLISDLPNVSAGTSIETATPNSSLKIGNNIQNKGFNCVAIGNNIVIPPSATNVTVIGNNVVVADGVINSSVINTNDYNLINSDQSVNNGVIVNDCFRVGYVETTNATPTKLLFDTVSGEFDVNLDNSYRIEVRIIAVDANTLDTKEWVAQGIVKNQSAIVTYDVIEAVTSNFSDAGIAATSVNISPGAFEYLDFTVTGIAATLIYWKCNVEYVRIVI